MKLPLEGIRVVELTHMVMGPSCGMILADLGAEVIKVEPRGKGDKTRYLPGSGVGLFPTFNRNKKSVQADLDNPDDLVKVKQLIASADVLVENFRFGKMAKYGLDYKTLRQVNKGIICCSLKGFQQGPYGHRAALDEVVQMLGGLGYMTGPPGNPLRAGASVNDIMGGMFGVIGIMAALMNRQSTGEGAEICSSLFENNAFLVGTHLTQGQLSGEAPRPMPSREASWAVYDIFHCLNDEMIFIGAVSDTQWGMLCQAFELHDLATDTNLETNAGRVQRRDRIHKVLEEVLSRLPIKEVEQRCEDAGLPFARVNTPLDLAEDLHLLEIGALAPTKMPDGREILTPLVPLTIDGELLKKRTDIPSPGQHTEEIMSELENSHNPFHYFSEDPIKSN